MSFLACHAMKISGSLQGVENHIERKSKKSKNPDIDRDKSHENFDALTGEKIHSMDYEKKFSVIMEKNFRGKRRPRKDAVKLISFVVSSDRQFFDGLTEQQTRDFFKISASFLAEKFPHVVTAQVHMDEKTPHMHMAVVPLTEDGRLSAKTLLDRKALQEIQDGLPKVLQAAGFDIQRGISNPEKSHQNTDDWKREQAVILREKAAQAERLQEQMQEIAKPEKNLFRQKTGKIVIDGEKFAEMSSVVSQVAEYSKMEKNAKMTIKNAILKGLKEESRRLEEQYAQKKARLEQENKEVLKHERAKLEDEMYDEFIDYKKRLQREVGSLPADLRAAEVKNSILQDEKSQLQEQISGLKRELQEREQDIMQLQQQLKEREQQSIVQISKPKAEKSRSQEWEKIEKEMPNGMKMVISRPSDGRGGRER